MALVNVWRHLIGCTENFVALIGQVDFSNPSPVVQPIQDVIGLAESGRGTVGIINVRIRNHNACRSPGPALLGSKYIDGMVVSKIGRASCRERVCQYV